MCTYLGRGRYNSVFSNVLLISIFLLLLHGIARNFIWNIYAASNYIDIISVIIPQQGALQLRFFESSCDSHNLASIAWNNTKLNIRYAYYMVLHSSSLGTNSSIGGAVMPL